MQISQRLNAMIDKLFRTTNAQSQSIPTINAYASVMQHAFSIKMSQTKISRGRMSVFCFPGVFIIWQRY